MNAKKAKKAISVLSIPILGLSLAGCSSDLGKNNTTNKNDISSDMKDKCKKWVKNADGSYKCEDSSSSYHGYYGIAGQTYPSQSAMQNSNIYKSRQEATSSNGSSGSSSGFVSGGTNSSAKSNISSESSSSKSSSSAKAGFGQSSKGSSSGSSSAGRGSGGS